MRSLVFRHSLREELQTLDFRDKHLEICQYCMNFEVLKFVDLIQVKFRRDYEDASNLFGELK